MSSRFGVDHLMQRVSTGSFFVFKLFRLEILEISLKH